MAKKIKFMGRSVFENWLKLDTKNQYSSYLANLWNNSNIAIIENTKERITKQIEKLEEQKEIERLEMIENLEKIKVLISFYRKIKKAEINYLTATVYFAINGFECYSFTILDFTEDLIYLAGLLSKNKSLLSYLTQFRSFIENLTTSSKLQEDIIKENDFDEYVKNIDIIKPFCAKKSIHKIDGNESLARVLGEKVFIKMAIEDSYFLLPDIVKDRFNEIKELFDNSFMKNNVQQSLPARKTTREEDGQTEGYLENDYFKVDELEIPVNIDSNGNQQVCSLINKATGYYHQTGKDNIFQNFIISHIWGHAYDPRYFTNWWNVVLVPAWANGLLDKDNCRPESLASKFRATIMKICHILYEDIFNDEDLWSSLKFYPKILNPNDVVNNNYMINVLAKGESLVKNQTHIGKILHKELPIGLSNA